MLSFPNLLLDLVHPLIHNGWSRTSGSVPRSSWRNLRDGGAPRGGELTGVAGGRRSIEFLPVMINRAGAVIAPEVIRGMPELSCNPVSSHLRLRSPSVIHCSPALVIPGANEEAVIDPRGQRPLCSAGSYQPGRSSGFRTKTPPVWNSARWGLIGRPAGPPPQSAHVVFPSAPSEESCSRTSRDESERRGGGARRQPPPEDPERSAPCNLVGVFGQPCVGHSWRGR